MKPKLSGRILRHILELNSLWTQLCNLCLLLRALKFFWDKILSQIKFILPKKLSFSFPICLLLKMGWRFSETFPSWDLILWVTPSPFIICTRLWTMRSCGALWQIEPDTPCRGTRCTSWEAYGATSFIYGQLGG